MENQTTGQTQPFNLQARVVNILTKPKQEWPVIATEPRDIAGLFKNYVVLLAAIPAICTIIGQAIIGISLPFYGHYRVPIVRALTFGVVSYVLGLIGIYVAALVIAKLAPTFQSEPDTAQAAKLTAYAWTPAWVAGILFLIPALSPLVLLASLYGIYLLYLGVSPMMKTPAEKAIPYLVVSFVVLIVVYFVIGMIAMAIVPMGIGLPAVTGPRF